MKRADYVGEALEVWPDNWDIFTLFAFLQTQWRVAMGGPYGLDYNVMFHKLDRMGLAPDEYREAEEDLQAMEREALSVMGSKE